tara:strand:+ start:428 stop:676 length:249 start_codon:yes stop_codon:yes gene_type:complete
MKLGKTALYYNENPEARQKKSEYDKKFQKKREQVKKRVECNKFNRKNKKYGNGDKMDCSHKNGRLTYESQKTNRARGGKNKS